MTEDVKELIERLEKRVEIRQAIPREEPDRIARDLRDAANALRNLSARVDGYESRLDQYRGIAAARNGDVYGEGGSAARDKELWDKYQKAGGEVRAVLHEPKGDI